MHKTVLKLNAEYAFTAAGKDVVGLIQLLGTPCLLIISIVNAGYVSPLLSLTSRNRSSPPLLMELLPLAGLAAIRPPPTTLALALTPHACSQRDVHSRWSCKAKTPSELDKIQLLHVKDRTQGV